MKNRRDGHEPLPTIDAGPHVPSRTWRAKYACKKNKGDHVFVIDTVYCSGWQQDKDGTYHNPEIVVTKGGIRWWRGLSMYIVNWKCTACNKIAVESKPPQKKFDKYRI